MSKLKLSSNASGSGNVTLESPNTNSDFTVTVPSGTGALPLMKLETAKTASGTSVDFTGIPSWVKRVTVMFNGVSTSGTSPITVQLGDAGGIETTGYTGGACNQSPTYVANTVGLNVHATTVAASSINGIATLLLMGGTSWVLSAGTQLASTNVSTAGGSKTLSDTLTQVRITTVNGTDTFDAGTINILYEG
jgi:hypothetical protein